MAKKSKEAEPVEVEQEEVDVVEEAVEQEEPKEPKKPKEPKMTRFISKGKHITVMLRPSRTSIVDGQQVLVHDRILAKFENGVFETNDKYVIKLAKKSPSCGVDYVCAN